MFFVSIQDVEVVLPPVTTFVLTIEEKSDVVKTSTEYPEAFPTELQFAE